MKVTESFDVRDEDLLKAASLRFDRHFPAISLIAALHHSPATEWKVIFQFTAQEIIEEIDRRNLDLSELEVVSTFCDCCWNKVVDSPLYKAVRAAQKAPEEVQ